MYQHIVISAYFQHLNAFLGTIIHYCSSIRALIWEDVHDRQNNSQIPYFT